MRIISDVVIQQLCERVMSIFSKLIEQTVHARHTIIKHLCHKHKNDETTYMYFTWLLIKRPPVPELSRIIFQYITHVHFYKIKRTR